MNSIWVLFFLASFPADTTHYPPATDTTAIVEYFKYQGGVYNYSNIPLTHERRGTIAWTFYDYSALTFALRHQIFFAPYVVELDSAGQYHFFDVQQWMLFDTLPGFGQSPAGYEARLIERRDWWNIGTPPPPPDLVIYKDSALTAPWTYSGWSATIAYNTAEQSKSGTAIRAVLKPWGAVGFHSGEWGKEQTIYGTDVETFRAEIYSPKALKVRVNFTGLSTSGYKDFALLTGWNSIAVDVATLPTITIRDVYVQNFTGGSVTLYLDNVRFTRRTP
jgi:hypothetical protein